MLLKSLFVGSIALQNESIEKIDLTNLKENYVENRNLLAIFFGKLKIMCKFANVRHKQIV